MYLSVVRNSSLLAQMTVSLQKWGKNPFINSIHDCSHVISEKLCVGHENEEVILLHVQCLQYICYSGTGGELKLRVPTIPQALSQVRSSTDLFTIYLTDTFIKDKKHHHSALGDAAYSLPNSLV